ncbi:MAG: DUF4331 family protein [Micromonosporaceae bacterium]
MSHHLDSPLARQDPRLDISDVYLFPGQLGTVFVMNVNPLSGKDGFHPEAMYEFKIDTDGDAVEEITFRVTFGSRDATGRQPVELRKLVGEAARDRSALGEVVASGHTETQLTGDSGIQLWAGGAAEPFYIEGTVITAVKTAVANGAPLDLDDFDPAQAANLFAGTNVSSIVLEAPAEVFGVHHIGFWGVTTLATDSGGWRQINRCANPLVNSLFDFSEGNEEVDYNATVPSDDHVNYGDLVREQTARVVAAMGTASDPKSHGTQFSNVVFPDVLRYEVGSAASYGVTKRNGRGLTEPTPEAMFELLLNVPVSLGLDASSATGVLRSEFPYLGAPVPVPAG